MKTKAVWLSICCSLPLALLAQNAAAPAPTANPPPGTAPKPPVGAAAAPVPGQSAPPAAGDGQQQGATNSSTTFNYPVVTNTDKALPGQPPGPNSASSYPINTNSGAGRNGGTNWSDFTNANGTVTYNTNLPHWWEKR